MDSPIPPAAGGMERSGRFSSSAASLRATSPVEPRKTSHRPKSAASSSRRSSSSSSALSLSKRPNSAAASSGSRSGDKHGYSNYQRSDSKDSTAARAAEQRLLHLSTRSSSTSTASCSVLPPRSPSVLSDAVSEHAWDSDVQRVPSESPGPENQQDGSGSQESGSPESSPRLENVKESLCEASRLLGLPPPVCPPSCVCQLPQAERDAALKRKKKISFQADQLPGGEEDSDAGGRKRLSASPSSGCVSPRKGSGSEEPGQLSELIVAHSRVRRL